MPSSKLFCDQVQPQVLGIHPYVPGKPISELQRELGLSEITKLASNENPLGASPLALQAIKDELTDIARYPDGGAYALKTAIAKFIGLTNENIAIGNGSNEVLELVARVFAAAGDEIIYSQYAFAVYPISTQIVGATGVEVPAKNWGHDLQAMLAAITDKTKIIYIANPNNPTGTFFTQQEWQAFITKVPRNVIVVLDEAYLEYAVSLMDPEQHFNGADYIKDYSNLLVSRTFSKAYGLAALRVGYMAGHVDLISYINQVREPFNVNQMAQAAAIKALEDQAFVAESIKVNKLGLQQVIHALDLLEIGYIPSVGNFVCIDLGSQAMQINQALLHKGVIVRPVANYGMDGFLRVSIGTQLENQHFIDALTEILKSRTY